MLLLYLLVQNRRKSLQVISAFAGAACQDGTELAHHHIREIMICCGGPQQVGIKLRGVLDICRPSRQQLKKFRIVDDLGPLGVFKQRREGPQRFSFFVRPYRSPLAGFGRNFDSCDSRPESFRFALTEIEIQPNRKRLFRRKLCQIFMKFRGIRQLRVVGFPARRRNFRCTGRHCAGAQFLQEGVEA